MKCRLPICLWLCRFGERQRFHSHKRISSLHFIFTPLTVVLLLGKGACPKNVHVGWCHWISLLCNLSCVWILHETFARGWEWWRQKSVLCSTVACLHGRDFRHGGVIKPSSSKVREINPLCLRNWDWCTFLQLFPLSRLRLFGTKWQLPWSCK